MHKNILIALKKKKKKCSTYKYCQLVNFTLCEWPHPNHGY